jgi:Holliday junction resolvase-like predicted endonuclease
MVNIIKWDGRIEPLQKDKIIKTLNRLGVPQENAIPIADKIIEGLKEDTTSIEILNKIYKQLEADFPDSCLQNDLRNALSKLKPIPDFEKYVSMVLEDHGYSTSLNLIINGACVSHEVDIIAKKDNEIIFIEVKHHSNFHNYTPFGISLAAKAKWDDIRKGYTKGLNDYPINRVLIITNTKLTDKAKEYAHCIGIEHLGWNEPKGFGLEIFIEEKKIYPITILSELSSPEYELFSKKGILTIKQLVALDQKINGISDLRLTKLKEQANKILEIKESCEII